MPVRHRPESTLLYRLVELHYPVFRDLRSAAGRPLPEYVQQEFDAYLKCGRLEDCRWGRGHRRSKPAWFELTGGGNSRWPAAQRTEQVRAGFSLARAASGLSAASRRKERWIQRLWRPRLPEEANGRGARQRARTTRQGLIRQVATGRMNGPGSTGSDYA